MTGYFTKSEISMMTTIAQGLGIKDTSAFVNFCEAKQKQFGNVTGGYNPQQSIEATARKFLKSIGQ